MDIPEIASSRVIVPKDKRWDDLLPGGPRVRDGCERIQPAVEEGEAL